MKHAIYRVVSFEIIGDYKIRIVFDDNSSQEINFQEILEGELFAPLKDLSLFNQVKIDPEVHTLIWPNGADFDPATLHDWPEQKEGFKRLLNHWTIATT